MVLTIEIFVDTYWYLFKKCISQSFFILNSGKIWKIRSFENSSSWSIAFFGDWRTDLDPKFPEKDPMLQLLLFSNQRIFHIWIGSNIKNLKMRKHLDKHTSEDSINYRFNFANSFFRVFFWVACMCFQQLLYFTFFAPHVETTAGTRDEKRCHFTWNFWENLFLILIEILN